MSEPVVPSPVAEGPPVPNSVVPEEEFDPAYEAFNTWERNVLRPGMNDLASGAFVNTGLARAAANTATAVVDVVIAARDATIAALALAMNSPGTIATSTTSLALTIGPKAFTIQPGKALGAGQYVTLGHSAYEVFYGRLNSYDDSTGAVVMEALTVMGAGTFATWTMAVSGPPAQVSRNKLFFFAGA